MTSAPKTMRAVVNAGAGGTEVLELQRRPVPQPGIGQIRVRVHASALNRADIAQRLGRYPAPAGVPADIPGLEYAGEVDALGDGVMLWSLGDRVMGIVGGGGHAEYLCVHEREVLPVPRGLSWEEAAAIPEVFLTAYDALFRQVEARLGECVLVHAVGSGVGTAALQLARAAGITVIGTSRSPEKLTKAKELGLELAIDASRDWAGGVEQLVGANAIQAIVDLVAGDYLAGNLRVLATRGRLVVVGHTAGRRTELDYAILMSKRLRIVGTVLRARPIEEKIALAREFADRALPLFDRGTLRPVVDTTFSFADVRGAHERMEANESFGKLVLVWD
ncbi:MAG TPA: NAD(P)H-quinone oxidoreductase [Gemmatimonadaceae bacterium]|jgi:putative PIG3 family NAD(P)H quinone oxidoreductase